MAKQATAKIKLPDKCKLLLFLTLQVLTSEGFADEETNFSKYIIPTSIISQGNAKAPEYFDMVRNSFNSIYTKLGSWGCQGACWKLKDSKPFHIYLELEPDKYSNLNEILSKIAIDTLVLYSEKDSQISQRSYINLKRISKERATIACSFQHVNITDPTEYLGYSSENDCSTIFAFTPVLIWRLAFDLEIIATNLNAQEYISSVLDKVEEVLDEREVFLRGHPDKQVILHFDITNWLKALLPTAGFYCNENKLAIYTFFEALAKKAVDREIPIVFNSVMGDTLYPEWIGTLSAPHGVGVYSETFYPVKRNYPNSLSPWLGKIDMCINKTQNISEHGIPFNKSLSGVTLNVNIRESPLSEKEAQVMLQLVMEKFTRVELQLGEKVENLNIVSTALKKVFDGKLNGVDNTEFFVQVNIPNESPHQYQYMKGVKKIVKVIETSAKAELLGVHAFHDNNLNGNNISGVVSVLTTRLKDHVNIGVSLASCGLELEYLLKDSSRKIPSNVDYIFCNGEKARGGRIEWNSNQLLDGFLVAQKAFQKVVPNVKAHFKIDISGRKGLRFGNVEKEDLQSAEVLGFISDVSQFSQMYRMSYFLSPAFGDVNNQHVGWWTITNYSDFSDATMFIEKEAAIIKIPESKEKTTIIKDFESPRNVDVGPVETYQSYVMWIIGILIVLAILLVSIILKCRKRKTSILSEAEVGEFLQGKKQTRGDIEMTMNDYLAVGFESKYKIPKVGFNEGSNEILGMGNFGTVFRAKVRDSICAVKIPTDSCSKESFKSMLTEVKLLRYIGDHINIIQFVGAYTNEIRNGVIQIATSLCENGSLLSNLRIMKGNLSTGDGTGIQPSALRNLIQFSKEIASGMMYIAGKNVVHGDLSARNILLDLNNTCKIADFGLSRKLYEYNKYVKKSQEPLPWRWMSYESLTQMEFTTKTDMWSYGITLWEIFTLGDIPYPGLAWSTDFTDELFNGMRMSNPRFASPQIFSKISDCWNIDPKKRPEFEEMKIFMETLNTDYTILNEI